MTLKIMIAAANNLDRLAAERLHRALAYEGDNGKISDTMSGNVHAPALHAVDGVGYPAFRVAHSRKVSRRNHNPVLPWRKTRVAAPYRSTSVIRALEAYHKVIDAESMES